MKTLFQPWIYDPDQPIRYVFSLAELRFTTQINQLAMSFEWFSYDLRPRSTNTPCFSQWLSYDRRPRSTNSLCFYIGSPTIYDPDQPIRICISVAELLSKTQIKQFLFLSVAELRSTTKINQLAMCFEWLNYDL